MSTQNDGASTPGLEDLAAPARELTAEESGEIQGGGGVILERRGGSLAGDGSSDGVAIPDAKSGGGSKDGVVVHD